MCNIKKIVLLSCLIVFATRATAQKLGVQYLPSPDSSTPSWALLLYNDTINANELEAAYNLYYSYNSFEKSIYTQYYKRWFMHNMAYIQPNGSVYRPQLGKVLANNTLSRGVNYWQALGPFETFKPSWQSAAQEAVSSQVNIYSFDIAPSNHNILYAGPETGGIFKSVDKGLTWFSVSDTLSMGNILAIAIDPINPDIVFAGGDGNIYKTTNGGGNWFKTTPFNGYSCNDIAILPSNHNKIIAALSNGYIYSNDGGVSWVKPIVYNGNVVYDIEVNPARDSTIYILQKAVGSPTAKVYKSTNAGLSFSLQANGWPTTATNSGRMANTPADTNYVYAVLLMGNPIDAPKIMRTIDGGNTWINTCTGIANSLTGNSSMPLGMSNGQGFYDLSMVVSTQDPTQVIVGSTTAYKSIDTANTFSALGGYLGLVDLHPDFQEMKMIGNDCWISTDGGINYSNDFFGTHNVALNKGIYGVDFWGFGQGWNEDVIIGGRYHNGNTALYEGYGLGQSFRLGGGEAGTGYAMIGNREREGAFSDINNVIIPQAFNGPNGGTFPFYLYPNEDSYGFDASEVEFWPSCYNIMLVGKDSSLWKSTDGGGSYVELYNFKQRVKKFEICRSNPDVLYLATSNRLYRSADGGKTWQGLTLPTGVSISRMSISVSFTNENELWICSNGTNSSTRIHKSIDGGTTWINLTTPKISSYSFAVVNHQAGTDGGVYITSRTEAKVFYRNNSMTEWVDYSAQLPMIYSPLNTRPFYKTGKLRTAGNRGVWEIDFYEPSQPLAQPTVDKLQSNCTRDTFYFDDFSVLRHVGSSWKWSFPGASYVSDSNARSPKVLYPGFGRYTATLTITQDTISSTKQLSVEVLNQYCSLDTLPGLAVNLRGNNSKDYVDMPPLGLNSNTLTITAWIKINGIQPDYSCIFMHDGQSAGFNFVPGNNHLGFHWPNGAWWWDSGLEVPTNQWTHVAMVVKPTGVELYVNGIGAYNNFTVNMVDFDSHSRLGNYKGWAGRYMNGIIDEVCIYNRSLSQAEIRATRHLTKKPSRDPSLVAYYQFNEPTGLVYDKASNINASLSGATKVQSTAPFAAGQSYSLNLNTGGSKDFIGTGVKMELSTANGAIYPNGEVVVSKLNTRPNLEPNNNPVGKQYWIINNYGSNKSFTPLPEISFGDLPALGNSKASDYSLFLRSENNEGATWGNAVDSSSTYIINGNNSLMAFTSTAPMTSFGQMVINSSKAIVYPVATAHIDAAGAVLVFPNPTNDRFYVDIKLEQSGESQILLFDLNGNLVHSAKQHLSSGLNRVLINTLALPSGAYMVQILANGKATNTRVIVQKQ